MRISTETKFPLASRYNAVKKHADLIEKQRAISQELHETGILLPAEALSEFLALLLGCAATLIFRRVVRL